MAGQVQFPQLGDAAWLRAAYVDECRSSPDIAREIGCTAPAVRHALKRHGIAIRKPPPAVDALAAPAPRDVVIDVDLARRRFAEGATLRAVADELGLSVSGARRALQRLGVATPGNRVRYPRLHSPGWVARQYVNRGRSAAEIAGQVGCRPQTVLAVLHQQGIPLRPAARQVLQLDVADVRAQFRGGASATAVARALGVSRNAFVAACQRQGIEVPDTRRKASIRAELAELQRTVDDLRRQIEQLTATLRRP